MKEIVFAVEFRGSAAPEAGSDKKLRAKTSATSQTLRSVLRADAIQGGIGTAGEGSASFESEVEIVGEGSSSSPEASGMGRLARSPSERSGEAPSARAPSPERGAVMWEVTRGEGRLAGAQGLITSNFTVGAQGEVVDNQYARLFLP